MIKRRKRARNSWTLVKTILTGIPIGAIWIFMQGINLHSTLQISFADLRALTFESAINGEPHEHADDKKSIQTTNECLKNRGTSGNWYINETMARQTFYSFQFRSTKWKNTVLSKNREAVYPGNIFAWNDTTSFPETKKTEINNRQAYYCSPIQPLTKDRFCAILKALGLERIYMVGDSLMGAQHDSLVGLLGYPPSDFTPQQKRAEKKRSTIECPDHQAVAVVKRRENLGPNLRLSNVRGRKDNQREDKQQFGPEIAFCDGQADFAIGVGKLKRVLNQSDLCPWMVEYNSSKASKTLLILNQGAHFHSTQTFQDSFDRFIQIYKTKKLAHGRGDIIVYRSTVPGHNDCFSTKDASVGISPLNMTHDSFLRRYATSKYDWNLFDKYNVYAKAHLSELDSSSKGRTHYLNVYNMTVLRADEHVAANDCLHYSHPGPIDFWNHLLFTNLEDMITPSNKSDGIKET